MKNFFTLSVVVVALYAASCVKESEGNILKTGDTIPSFTVDGPWGTFSSTAFAGNGGVLVFFASYCSTCQAVMPEIERIWESSREGSLFTVAALSRQNVYGEDEQSVADYWARAGYSIPYYLDIDGDIYYRFAKETIPRVYVINKDRKITYMSVGDSTLKAEEIAKAIEQALGTYPDI